METEVDEPTTDEEVADEPAAGEEETSDLETPNADDVGNGATSGVEATDGPVATAEEDAIDLDELATLVADRIRGDGGNGSDEDELMAKIKRVVRDERDAEHSEDRIADKVAAKVGSRSPDPPPSPEYRRLAKLLFGKRS